jgi:hypothetical protein
MIKVTSLICIQAIERFNIATSFPVDGEASFAAIAKNTGISEEDAKRVLRQAMTQHIFKEPRPGYVTGLHLCAMRNGERHLESLTPWQNGPDPKNLNTRVGFSPTTQPEA